VGAVAVKGLRTAASFLTRVPFDRGTAERPDLAGSLPWFPVIGGLLGLGLAGAYAGILQVLPAFPAAAITLGISLLLTGALHEDGLADTADALGGGRTREEVLSILKDPAHGTYGVLAIVMSLALRISALATLDGWTALAVLPGAHALSRGAVVGLLGIVSPATDEGLGASFVSALTPRETAAALGTALLIGAASLGGWVTVAAPVAATCSFGVGLVAVRRIGGITGDLLGAAQQASEIFVILIGAAVAASGWSSVAWWR
jgi:adenosylcobinamide-GDP ribazoletransferase